MKFTRLSPSKIQSTFLMLVFAFGAIATTGCDMGTYSKRLKEQNSGVKKSAPVKADDTESEDEGGQ